MSAAQILVVCTGNICRSPYLELTLGKALAGHGYQVSSGGTRAMVGYPIDPRSLEQLHRIGIDDDGFRARQLTPQMIGDADLVLTATRQHRSEVVTLQPKALKYTFALADFSQVVAELDAPVPTGADEPGSADRHGFLARLLDDVRMRRTTLAPRDAAEVDIVDPYGQSPEVFVRMADQIGAVLPPVVRALTLKS